MEKKFDKTERESIIRIYLFLKLNFMKFDVGKLFHNRLNNTAFVPPVPQSNIISVAPWVFEIINEMGLDFNSIRDYLDNPDNHIDGSETLWVSHEVLFGANAEHFSWKHLSDEDYAELEDMLLGLGYSIQDVQYLNGNPVVHVELKRRTL